MNEFWIDAQQVRAAAPGFLVVGDRIRTAITRLTAALDAEGRCWAGDDYGRGFEKEYLPGRDQVFEYLPQVAGALHDIGQGLREMADTADRGETASHRKFT